MTQIDFYLTPTELLEKSILVKEDIWKKHINILKHSVYSSSLDELKQVLITAIKKRIPKAPFGVFLSGGLDSAFIVAVLKQLNVSFTCYAVGLKDSPDIIATKFLTEKLCLKTKVYEINLNDAEIIFKRVASFFDKPDVLNVGIGSVIYSASELAKKEGITVFFGGLGSEEIFAGYQRHRKVIDVQEECWRGLHDVIWSRDFQRDIILEKKLNISIKLPFLDDAVITTAMGISGEQKIFKGRNKYCLRLLAEKLGVPKEIAWRDKKAAQYGSWMDKALGSLAKLNNFSSKQKYIEYLKSVNEFK